jgi:hypothetical protein
MTSNEFSKNFFFFSMVIPSGALAGFLINALGLLIVASVYEGELEIEELV